jgi:hypothetical protein
MPSCGQRYALCSSSLCAPTLQSTCDSRIMTEVRDRRNGRCDVRKQRFAFMVGPGANEKKPQLVSTLRHRRLHDTALAGDDANIRPVGSPLADSEGRKFPAQASNRYYLPFGLSFGKAKSITNPFLSLSASEQLAHEFRKRAGQRSAPRAIVASVVRPARGLLAVTRYPRELCLSPSRIAARKWYRLCVRSSERLPLNRVRDMSASADIFDSISSWLVHVRFRSFAT